MRDLKSATSSPSYDYAEVGPSTSSSYSSEKRKPAQAEGQEEVRNTTTIQVRDS